MLGEKGEKEEAVREEMASGPIEKSSGESGPISKCRRRRRLGKKKLASGPRRKCSEGREGKNVGADKEMLGGRRDGNNVGADKEMR